MTEESKEIWGWIYRVLGTILILSSLMLWGCPNYRVYQQNLEGEAELARATQNRQIEIQEAQAKAEAAEYLSKAEIERAKGVAEANRIIGESLKGNESYLRYLWIEKLDDDSGTIIYVPTEAGLPILEAGRFNKESFQP
jgi:regulator of protease activity HflC (stomatin/prohibitin superfamily)